MDMFSFVTTKGSNLFAKLSVESFPTRLRVLGISTSLCGLRKLEESLGLLADSTEFLISSFENEE